MNAKLLLVPEDISHECIDGEVIAINLEKGLYHSLRGSAAVIWTSITEGCQVAEILSRFDGAPPEAASELQFFLDGLAAAGLVVEGSPAAPAQPATAPKTKWEAPVLETFDDLSQLLLADPIHDVGDGAWPELQRAKP